MRAPFEEFEERRGKELSRLFAVLSEQLETKRCEK